VAREQRSPGRRETKASQTTKAKLGVRELVFEGELAPGERVPEVALAERLGISRTPLRIALESLAHEGLLQRLRSGGFVVGSFSRADIDDGIELRGVLEGTAARFAAERLESPGELAPLVETTAALDDVVGDLSPATIGRYAELNDAYHAALVRLAKSTTLARAIAQAVVLPFASPGALLQSQAVLPGSREILVVAQHQHRVLIDAIRAGQGTRAEQIGREHARLAQQSLALVLANHEVLAQLEGASLLQGVA
jgi:GntR family transcriptional regulator, vanillate catabolism transcriptional regulator